MTFFDASSPSVLDRVEQQAVVLLEDRQNRLARHRRPGAEHHRDLFLLEQVARLFGEQRPIRRGIHDDRLQLPSEQSALAVLLFDEHQDRVLERGFADGHGAGQRVQHADLDRPRLGTDRDRHHDGGSHQTESKSEVFQLHGCTPGHGGPVRPALRKRPSVAWETPREAVTSESAVRRRPGRSRSARRRSACP